MKTPNCIKLLEPSHTQSGSRKSRDKSVWDRPEQRVVEQDFPTPAVPTRRQRMRYIIKFDGRFAVSSPKKGASTKQRNGLSATKAQTDVIARKGVIVRRKPLRIIFDQVDVTESTKESAELREPLTYPQKVDSNYSNGLRIEGAFQGLEPIPRVICTYIGEHRLKPCVGRRCNKVRAGVCGNYDLGA